jgi:RNA polymerase sigma factor (sigma-70 family)
MIESRRRELHLAMVRFSDGDRGAFRAVFDGLWPVLLAFTRGMRLGPADAEDAAQRALLLVFSRIADLDPERDGVAWALTLASYEVLTLRKQQTRRREAPVMALADTRDARPGPEEATIADDLRRCLRVAIGELHEADRVALDELLADAELDPSERGRKRRYRASERLRAWWRRVHG